MAIRFRNEIGQLTLVQKRNLDGAEKTYRYLIHIFDGNCDAVFNTETEDSWHLWMLWIDNRHVKNIAKDCGNIFCGEKVTNIKLNMYFPTAKRVLKYLLQYGYEVKCYYKQPKKTKK